MVNVMPGSVDPPAGGGFAPAVNSYVPGDTSISGAPGFHVALSASSSPPPTGFHAIVADDAGVPSGSSTFAVSVWICLPVKSPRPPTATGVHVRPPERAISQPTSH